MAFVSETSWLRLIGLHNHNEPGARDEQCDSKQQHAINPDAERLKDEHPELYQWYFNSPT